MTHKPARVNSHDKLNANESRNSRFKLRLHLMHPGSHRLWRRSRRVVRMDHPTVVYNTVIHLSQSLLLCDLPYLMSYVHLRQVNSPVREMHCDLKSYAGAGQNGCDPLLCVLERIPTLECVLFRNKEWHTDIIDPYIDAVSQNDAIHTVKLENICCTANILRTLLQRKRHWVVIGPCRLVNTDAPQECDLPRESFSTQECDSYECPVQEIKIEADEAPHTMTNVLECVESLKTLPSLRVLSISSLLLAEGFYDDSLWTRLGSVLQMSPLLEELNLQNMSVLNPNMFSSLATTVNNAPCPHLTWHLSDCTFTSQTVPTLEEIVFWHQAKPMRLTLGPYTHLGKPMDDFLQVVLQGSSCVKALAYIIEDRLGSYPSKQLIRDRGLEIILQALEGRLTGSTCSLTTIELYLDPVFHRLYYELIQSIPKWVSYVQTLRLGCASHHQLQGGPSSGHDTLFPNDAIRKGFLNAVHNNLHLLHIDFDAETEYDDDGSENSRLVLQRYCARNQMLQPGLDKPYTIPMHLWPWILCIVGRSGPDSLYRCLQDNVAYVLANCDYNRGRSEVSLQKNRTRMASSNQSRPPSKNKWHFW